LVCSICYENRKLTLAVSWKPTYSQVKYFADNGEEVFSETDSEDDEGGEDNCRVLSPYRMGSNPQKAAVLREAALKRVKAPDNVISNSERTSKPGALSNLQKAQDVMVRKKGYDSGFVVCPVAEPDKKPSGHIFEPRAPTSPPPSSSCHTTKGKVSAETQAMLEAVKQQFADGRALRDAEMGALKRQLDALANQQAAQVQKAAAKEDD
jgi:hypothetical protein